MGQELEGFLEIGISHQIYFRHLAGDMHARSSLDSGSIIA
jgi:hypothetical protein